MPTNSELLLKGVVDAQAAMLAPGMKPDDFFELFCAVQLLKPYDLAIDEIRQGLLGGGGDGGIDGFYTLVDGEPLEAVTAPSAGQRDHNVELLIFQAKDSPGFSGTAIDKLVSTVTAVFDFSRPLGGLRKLYNEQLLERAEAFRQFYTASIAQIARLDVRFVYFSAGEHVHEAVTEHGATLTAVSERLFPDARTTVEFLGARELLLMSRTGRPEWYELQVREGPLVVGQSGFIGMVSLSDYAAFVTDERGNRRRALFTDNVRDYEGRYGVNGAISQTLSSPTDDDFWTLNNGVTLVVRQARAGYRVLALQDPRIVNGLQTTTEIFEHFKRSPDRDDRMLLVRVVVPQSDDSRDRIIVATNKQTPIAAGVLKATDKIHRDIEDYFAARGLYYERRRNEHRNDGRSLDTVVTMPYLARCMTATALLRPHLAVKVNAPSRLLTQPEGPRPTPRRTSPTPALLPAGPGRPPSTRRAAHRPRPPSATGTADARAPSPPDGSWQPRLRSPSSTSPAR